MHNQGETSTYSLVQCFRWISQHFQNPKIEKKVKLYFEKQAHLENKNTLQNLLKITSSSRIVHSCHSLQNHDLTNLHHTSLPILSKLTNGNFVIIVNVNKVSMEVSVFDPLAKSNEQILSIPLSNFCAAWTKEVYRFEAVNTSLVCFSLVAKEHKIEVTGERLIHDYSLSNNEIDSKLLIRIAKDSGLKAKHLQLNWENLTRLQKAYPAIIRLKNDQHLIVLGATSESKNGEHLKETFISAYDPLLSHDKNAGYVLLSKKELLERWDGCTYVIKRKYKLTEQEQPFSLKWFIPEILKQRSSFVDVALAVFFIHLISLVTPVFFQIVIDKVLVNQAHTTLQVLGIGICIALVVNAGLDFLRDYLLLHATNKIDLRVTGKTFRHMLNLPLHFFEKMTAGVLTKHIQQTASIREFLTGSLFLTVLEATSLFVFLPFLFSYSVKLSLIVLFFTCLIAIVIGSLIGPFRRRLNALYDAEGERQAMLVESINGISTVKAMAIEPTLRGDWEEKVAKAVTMQFRVGKISITAKSITQLFERLMAVAIIWFGANSVFTGQLTLGSLIAFQMLSGRVTSPLVRMVSLVNEYQEAALSVEKLGTVMNEKAEEGSSKHGARPSLNGDINFERVTFRYAPHLTPALQDISLNFKKGQIIGIVGPSGSGKTTLTRLIQNFYLPTAGVVRINGFDSREIDYSHLRTKIGIVLQESFLFRATVAENIMVGKSNATRHEVIEASTLAGSDEFVCKLPQGYDTPLDEGATNLSGGQRQRLSIARALITQPDILIFDEATSSLDPESEKIIRENLISISRNRTVIIVSHRLSMLTCADSIVVLKEGNIAEQGSHLELLNNKKQYHQMWHQQMMISSSS